MRLASRWIENGLYIPLGIHIDLYSARRAQRLVHTLVHTRCLHLRCEQRAWPYRSDDREHDDHHEHGNILPPTLVRSRPLRKPHFLHIDTLSSLSLLVTVRSILASRQTALLGRGVLVDRRAVRIEPDFAPERSMDIDLIGHGECESTEKPPKADPEAVYAGTRVEDGETVCRACRGD